ncbi:exopolysaccharide Pel transporter PelG [Rhodoferax saidenbachensis]|uniref:Histidine kinase n=1 Tax=Rhodoferax saidenbachensis TaxID=1484693 RepID=A0A1P8K7G2_9BURK|nr:exopolysaccharide Pel transporter PelG [Rhodoferax saidenbachensis]APW41934.1 histidine kinase [Rhodoferax saidenbachensis]
MAGIGFELRKLLRKQTYSGLLQAYAFAGIISSGPWVLSIIGIMLIGLLSVGVVSPKVAISQFQVTVTYLFLISLISTGLVQLSFTRFVADRTFAKDEASILPNFNGLILLAMGLSMILALPCVAFLFPEQTVLYRLLFVMGLGVMSAIWIATVFLTGMKHYRAIVLIFFLGYSATLVLALLFRSTLGMEGLLLGFVLGHYLLLMGMIWLIYRNYHSDRFIAFDIWKPGAMYHSLMVAGLLFNLGAWVDKLMFWYFPSTGQQVIGPLNASVIYDFPIFLSYLSVIPGMAIFLVRIETDFVEYYVKFYDAVREGATLDFIERMRNHMVYHVQRGLFDIAKIQTIAVLITFALGGVLLESLGISTLYLPLLYVDVVGAALQVVLLGILNILFYLDQRRSVVLLTAMLPITNIVFTAISLQLGAAWFGYGFAMAMLVTVLTGIWILNRKLEVLEYETFMLQ